MKIGMAINCGSRRPLERLGQPLSLGRHLGHERGHSASVEVPTHEPGEHC
jgi:hypothetical protein